ncbi:MAG TPA: Gfo/Idh/MocA family oxidoreductase [Terriglobia bacterium]|nr:Gfo/Idh/MocA family oxidoreductase [Terriglobia bacterium]
MSDIVKIAVVGAGKFGRQHARVYAELPEAELVGVYDADPACAAEVAAAHHCRAFGSLDELAGQVQAVSVAVPTEHHATVATKLLESGIDVLVEKPMARTLAEADQMIAASERHQRILQVGHLERFNPAVEAAAALARRPLFFEAHRLSPFSPRSLDVDVVMDLMIHDLDIVLSLVESEPEEIRAVGLAVLSPKFDIANVRVSFENGCVANFTASRVSTERVRKLRWFQPQEYLSVDYARQDAIVIAVETTGGMPMLSHRKLAPPQQEPLRRQLEDFLRCVRDRARPRINGSQGRRALALAHQIQQAMIRHAERLLAGRQQFARKEAL